MKKKAVFPFRRNVPAVMSGQCFGSMDKTRAKSFAKAIEGQVCSGWAVHDYINCGKSAIVLKAKKGDQLAAIKIFDPELIERYGAEIQQQRIDREKKLIGQSHPNLIQILDGGWWAENKVFFVVMEYLPFKNLADVLKDVPVGRERELIGQIASAARFLEGLQICHRDIKPENIAVDQGFQKVKLLDLGVIKPHGTKSITDGTNGKFFVGTIRYSPPEFLLGQEQDKMEDWRAITFYQLGGVLHDLIMRRPLFAGYENPFPRLINAVQQVKPEIESKGVSPALVELARSCLLKKPELRLKLVSWQTFEREPVSEDPVAELKSKISKRLIAKRDSAPEEKIDERKTAQERIQEYSRSITSICRLECVENPDFFPPIEIEPVPGKDGGDCIIIQFEPSAAHGLNVHLRIQVYVGWIDPTSDVVKVSVEVLIAAAAFNSKTPFDGNETTLFRGAYAADSVRRYVVPMLYQSLDAAQQAKKIAKGDTALHPLKIEETSK